MKHFVYALLAGTVLAGAVALSQPAKKDTLADLTLQITSEDRNPWTNLRINDSPEEFQFAVISDRTGGHREKIFSKAVEQLNLLQPAFVISVGDLIEGYTADREKVLDQWKEFQTFASKLQMPFFYTPGNHDLANAEEAGIWKEKFGRSYYHFKYKGVLFLILNCEEPPNSGLMSEEQVKWAKGVLAENADVRWTIVSFHRPIWTGNLEKNRWGEVEKALAGRNYTVFVGHEHRYVKYVRNGMNYYQLATTGGGSRLRGVRYGEFDHIVWVTMKKSGPVLANIMLDGVLPENLALPETVEPVTQIGRKATHPVKGFALIDGTPAGGATVGFHLKEAGKKGPQFIGDGIVEGDGSFALSCYGAFDGVPAGDYVVTIAHDGRYGPAGERKGTIPVKYSKSDTSPLTATVKAGKNEFIFEAKSE